MSKGKSFSPTKLHGGISDSNSPRRRKDSPPKDGGAGSLRTKKQDDIRSLRLQLTSLKAQLNAQEQDNMTLISKVTQLEDTIETQEKNYDTLQFELEEKIT